MQVTDGSFYQLSMMCVRAEAKATLQLVRCSFNACADCAAAASKEPYGVFEIDCTSSIVCTHDLEYQQEQLTLQRPAGYSGNSGAQHAHASGSGLSGGGGGGGAPSSSTAHTSSNSNSGYSARSPSHAHGGGGGGGSGNNTQNNHSSNGTTNTHSSSSSRQHSSSLFVPADVSSSGKKNGSSTQKPAGPVPEDSGTPEPADCDPDAADSGKGQGGIAIKALDSVLCCEDVHVRGSAWFRKGLSLHGCAVRLVSTTIADCHELGVHMVSGNTTLTGCKIDSCGQGFVADGSSAATKVQASNSVFTRGVTACVSMMTGSHGKFNACRMSGATGIDGCGMYVGLDGASAEATACMFTANNGWAVNVGDGGHATLHKCDARDNKKGGFWAMRGQLDLTDCSSEGRSQAAGVGALGEGGCVRAEGVSVVNGSGSGYQCIQGAAVDLVSCSATDCGNIGVVSGSGGRLTVSGVSVHRAEQGMCVSSATALAVDCTITECNVVGVTVDFHGNLQMMRCELKGEGKGALGLRVIHDGSAAEVKECKFSGHVQFGACVVAGGKCTLTGCESRSNSGAGFYVDEIRPVNAPVATDDAQPFEQENVPEVLPKVGADSAASEASATTHACTKENENGNNSEVTSSAQHNTNSATTNSTTNATLNATNSKSGGHEVQDKLKGVLNNTVVTTVRGLPNGITPPVEDADYPIPAGYEPPSRMILRSCRSIADHVGVITKCGGLLRAEGVTIREAASNGFQCDLGVGADILVIGGLIEKCGGSGVVTTGSGGGVYLQGIEIVDSHETGVVVYAGTQARGVSVTCRRNRVAGFAAVGEAAALQLEGCIADNPEHIGFRAEEGGEIHRIDAAPKPT